MGLARARVARIHSVAASRRGRKRDDMTDETKSKTTASQRYPYTGNFKLKLRHKALLEKIRKTNRLESMSQALRFVLDEMVEKGRG